MSKRDSSSFSLDLWKPFMTSANTFLQKTNEHALQGLNPGGVYQAIWCRDAAYILKDWFLSGNTDGVMQHIYQIWSHQISSTNKEKLVYGRGSPEMKFSAELLGANKQEEFEGALPTTIYQAGFSEIYGQNPDIDSTALIISTTSWILARSLKQNSLFDGSSIVSTTASEHSAEYVSGLLLKLGITDPTKAIDFLVPRMLKAVDYLARRDVDDDGLLEQDHNEDWMDTVLRAGKIVCSQACWKIGLKNLLSLLVATGKQNESDRIRRMVEKAIQAVEQILWSEEDGAYIDIQETHHIGGPYRTLTQDVSLYLVALTENTSMDNLTDRQEGLAEGKTSDQNAKRANL